MKLTVYRTLFLITNLLLIITKTYAVGDTLTIKVHPSPQTTSSPTDTTNLLSPSVDSLTPRPFSYNNVKDYIFTNIKYPPEALETEIEGTVLISFVINKSGRTDHIRIITPGHPLLNDEAIRLIKNMPRWKPILRWGRPIALYYEVPVIFELQKNEEEQNQ